MLKIGITLMIVSAAVFALVTATQLPMIIAAYAQNTTSGVGTTAENQTATTITIQKTVISTVDSLPGHQMHQAAMVLPARTDGKVWVGTLSWSASKPVEVRILQNYDTSVTPDTGHGKPVTAPFGDGEAAISLILPSNGAATVPSYNAGSLNFAASQVAFHTLGGVPFTVTYTVDAVAKSLTK
jgi:hypothetical protein